MLRNFSKRDLRYVAGWSDPMIRLVQRLKMGLPFGSEHALSTQALERQVEATKARKKVDETEWMHC